MAKIFCIGLQKTATLSLDRALQALGYKTFHYPQMFKDADNPQLEIDRAKVDQYDSISDIPVARYYKELDKMFPGSKFILTVREKEDWLESSSNHFKELNYNIVTNSCMSHFFGTSKFDRKKWIKGYDNHIKDVCNYFLNRGSDLLILDICAGEGWEKLCPFLDKPILNTPFPHLNKGVSNGTI